MFDAYCPHHQARVLLTSRRIIEMHPDGDAIFVRFRCWCGEIATTTFSRPQTVAS